MGKCCFFILLPATFNALSNQHRVNNFQSGCNFKRAEILDGVLKRQRTLQL